MHVHVLCPGRCSCSCAVLCLCMPLSQVRGYEAWAHSNGGYQPSAALCLMKGLLRPAPASRLFTSTLPTACCVTSLLSTHIFGLAALLQIRVVPSLVINCCWPFCCYPAFLSCLALQWELISGGDLLELLNECNGCMTETAAAFYYTQLLRAVLHIHAMGYCHRYVYLTH